MAFNYWQEIEEGAIYHMYNKSITDVILFKEESDYRSFLKKIEKYFSPYFEVYAYCLIPNHFHLLVKAKLLEEIQGALRKEKTKAAQNLIENKISYNLFCSDQFKRFFSSISISYNKNNNHQGPIFVRKLKKIKVSKPSTIIYLLCYIHHNPIHHGLVKTFEDWEYSSYKLYTEQMKTFLSTQKLLIWLGDLKAFTDLHINFKEDRLDINLE